MDLKKYMKLRTIYNEINEAFDFENIQTNQFTKIDDYNYESDNLTVEFQEVGIWDLDLPRRFSDANSCYNVLYKIDGKDSRAYKTDYKELIKILKTVKEIIEDFIKDNQPDILVIVAADRYGEIAVDSTKHKIYQMAISKNLPSGYGVLRDLTPIKGSGLEGIVLYRGMTFESITYRTGKRTNIR